MKRIWTRVCCQASFFVVMILMLAACGGGGGGSSASPSTNANASANLIGLSVTGQALSPGFQAGQLSYTVNVSYDINSVAINASAATGATIALTNAAGAALTATAVPLAEGSNRVLVQVTASDGATRQTYTLDITRQTLADFGKGYPASSHYQPEKLSRATYQIRVERGVAIPMRDGVVLQADIYYPIGEGKFPTLLARTPYGRSSDRRLTEANYFSVRGYVVVVQDTRGRYDSGGDYYPYRHEANDGFDTDEWIGRQTWSNGKIGTFGSSYVGFTQLTQAVRGSAYLTAIAGDATTSDIFNQWTYVDGAFHYGFTLPWGAVLMKGKVTQNAGGYDMRALPIFTADAAAGFQNQSYRDWLLHPRRNDPYWDDLSFEDKIHQSTVPMLVVEGWYDIFLRGALEDDISVRSKSPSALVRQGKRMLIGPWTHLPRGRNNAPGSPTSGLNRSLDFGAAAEVDMLKVYLRWYDYWLKGINNGVNTEPPIQIFVMGSNVWRHENEWPLARTQYTKYYLSSGGAANSVNGNGSLSTALPSGASSDTYTYNPADPVPTAGGNVCCGPVPEGPWNQASVEARNDVLVFTTPTLTDAVEVTGPIKMKLYASTTAVDTDWTAKLVDVHPDGYAQNIQDGIIRARYRGGKNAPASLLNPGQVYEVDIDLWASSNAFLPGHKIRVEISSSNFARFDRNLNTGEDPATGTRMQSAVQTIYHSAEYPSHILLPVIPK